MIDKFQFLQAATAFMTKGDLSGHVKSYHETIIDRKEDTVVGRKWIIAMVTDRVCVWQKGNCLAKETLLGQYSLFDKISKEVVKIKIKISNNFQNKGHTSLDCLTHFDTRSGPSFYHVITIISEISNITF